jgi:purine-binding chemotaxis protein CheW
MSQLATADRPDSYAGGIDHELAYLNQYVSFLVDGQLLGVPVNAVQEVLNPQAIAPTPRAKREITGLLNLRGQIVTAVDLRKRLNLHPLPEGQESMNVVIRYNDESFSLLVDEVGDVINVSRDLLQPPPHTLDLHWKEVTSGVFRLEDRLFVILDEASLLNF